MKPVQQLFSHEKVWSDYATWALPTGALRAVRSVQAMHEALGPTSCVSNVLEEAHEGTVPVKR